MELTRKKKTQGGEIYECMPLNYCDISLPLSIYWSIFQSKHLSLLLIIHADVEAWLKLIMIINSTLSLPLRNHQQETAILESPLSHSLSLSLISLPESINRDHPTVSLYHCYSRSSLSRSFPWPASPFPPLYVCSPFHGLMVTSNITIFLVSNSMAQIGRGKG